MSLRKKKFMNIVFLAIFVVFMLFVSRIEMVKAAPSVPTVTPSGGNPVNVIWRGNGYATLVTAQQIQLAFILPEQTLQARDYLITTEGHYNTIQT